MRQFISKSILYVVAIIAITMLVNSVFLNQRDYEWGESSDFKDRLAYVKENSSQYTTILVGSSKVRHHFKPHILDSICGTTSFNLGVNGMFVPTSYAMVEHLMNDESLSVERIFIDYSFITDISRYLGSDKSHYWITPYYLGTSIQMISDTEYDTGTKAQLIGQYTKLYFNKYLSIGKPAFSYEYTPKVITQHEKSAQGYYSLDDHMANNPTARLIESRGDFLADTSFLSRNRAALESVKSAKLQSNSGNKKIIDHLLNTAENRGVELLFVLQPNNYLKQIYSDFILSIPAENRIDLTQDMDLYSIRYHFDNGHFNDAGASRISITLAEEYNRLKNQGQ